VGAMLAGASRKSSGPVLDPARIGSIEQEIAALEARLGPLENFLLPGGTPCAASLHLARTVSRRAERDAVTLGRASTVAPQIRIYLNRLSDILFQFARWENKTAGVSEALWKSR